MNPNKTQDLLLLHHHNHLEIEQTLMDHEPEQLQPLLQPSDLQHLHHHHHPHQHQHQHQQDEEHLSLPSISEIVVFRDDDDEEDDEDHDKQVESPSPSSSDESHHRISVPSSNVAPSNHHHHHHHHHLQPPAYVNPDPHISTQFYTFNRESHSLMVQCIIERRLATPDEIRRATPRPVLKSWRSVWKDRNEGTAYLTAWKRIQDKLNAHIDTHGNQVLYFKNNSQQYVSHIDQWQEIVMSFHGDGDLKHLGLKDTIDRIKQVWTVGAKFYGIPESFIRVCVSSCPVCNEASGSAPRTKRRRFEYTESFDVPAKEVPHRLQQLAAKHKVVLCIRQKYIRYKPFMAEVKDYACHRAGEPAKKSKILKREPYASKRCGCGFRIRAIVPILNYNEKDKTFVYQEEGMAVFKLYAVHSGHEPGPLDGNARIIHRIVGHKGGSFLMDQDTVYGMSEDTDTDAYGLLGKDDGDLHLAVMHQMQELKIEVGLLEGRIAKVPHELLGSLSRELLDVVSRIRSIGEDMSRPAVGLLHEKQHSDVVLVGENELAHWGEHHDDQIYGDGKDRELIDEDEDSFGRTLGDVVPWDRIRTECSNRKDLLGDTCKAEKWLKDDCGEFDEKSMLDCEDSKLIKPLRHDETLVTDGSLVGIQVDSFYPENSKWYDSPCSLDPGTDCGDGGFRHEEIV